MYQRKVSKLAVLLSDGLTYTILSTYPYSIYFFNILSLLEFFLGGFEKNKLNIELGYFFLMSGADATAFLTLSVLSAPSFPPLHSPNTSFPSSM